MLDPEAADLGMSGIDNVAATISTLAQTYGITAAPKPVDAFADAVTRLCGDIEVTFGHTERLLLGLARAGIVTDEQRFALHAAYLRQKAGDVQPIQ